MFTVILTGIPKRSIHHQSTSIESCRPVHDRQLSRSIAVYRDRIVMHLADTALWKQMNLSYSIKY